MNGELYEKLTQLQYLLHKQHIRDYHGRGHLADSARGQGRILAALKMRDGVSAKDLSYLLDLHVASLNEMLAKLVKGGYVVREASEQDKRVTLVRLTEKGRSEEQPEPADFGGIFGCLSGEEQTAFGDYLDRVTDALRAKLGGGEGADDIERLQAERERMLAGFAEKMFEGRFGGRRGPGGLRRG
ncbi:MAG: winged helix DNA-binding protein [Clostridiales bacterium]|jgi:DNA-binding MarR family transcriptional regulator|nr:winged helix DNA-binding protein [Clostridiales bacterium]